MGACYSVELKVKFKDELSAKTALQSMLKVYPHTNFGIEEFAKEGTFTEKIDDIIKIFLAGWKQTPFKKKKDDDMTVYSNDFDACYGWEIVMIDMFKTICPFLENGSSFYIEPDDDYDELEARDGKCIFLH